MCFYCRDNLGDPLRLKRLSLLQEYRSSNDGTNSQAASEANRTVQHDVTWARTGDIYYLTSGIYAIKQLLVLVLNRLPSDVALGSGPREGAALDNDDVFGGRNALMDIVAVVELSHSPDDLLFELLDAHRAFLRHLDKQGRTDSAFSDDYALRNELPTCGTNAVLDRPEVTNSNKRL